MKNVFGHFGCLLWAVKIEKINPLIHFESQFSMPV